MDTEIVFSVEELEARFEMESLAISGTDLLPDWSCDCTIRFSM